MISLIIPFYKKTSFLKLILESLVSQRYRDFEVIVAEDDHLQETKDFLRDLLTKINYPLKHLHQQKDDGFRKNEMLNKAIKASSGDILVFLDGDCIPHKIFLSHYSELKQENTVWFGRRVMFGKSLTQNLISSGNLKMINLMKIFLSDSNRKKYSLYMPFSKPRLTEDRGIWGCNWGIRKETILKVNGFDEDYVRAGVGEDVDIEWRLRKNGCKFIYMPQRVIVYHLHHDSNYSQEDIEFNLELGRKKKEEGLVYCKNGLVK
jgi:cellulose synthase/poly-beta-1,6-N-acetylglucosamine synthase-like glycosyltransferase